MKEPESLLPCPYCGSNQLTTNYWSIDDSEQEAVECKDCNGSNLRKNWNNRSNDIQLHIQTKPLQAIYSLCPGTVIDTTSDSIVIEHSKTQQRYHYTNVRNILLKQQIVETGRYIGYVKEGHWDMQLIIKDKPQPTQAQANT